MDSGKSTKGLEMKYFVLKPKGYNPYAKASRKAMLRYAEEIRIENPTLAKELKDWVLRETPETNCDCGYCDRK